MKANLLRSLSSIPAARIVQSPAERSRLYFLLCWLHAIVQERLRYRPLGWANSYEFSDADLRVACDTLDSAVNSVALVSLLVVRPSFSINTSNRFRIVPT